MGLHASGLMEFRTQHLDYRSIICPTVRDLTGTFSWPQQNPFLLGNPETFVCLFFFFLRSNPRAIENSGALCDPMNHSLPDCGHGISRQQYWCGLPCPPPRDLPDPGIELHLFCLLHWQMGSLPLVLPGNLWVIPN